MPKTVRRSESGKIVSFNGELRLLEQRDGWKQRVELWLLNDVTNENNWRYENLENHRRMFSDTPILVAYVDGKVGDGHNFDEIKTLDGSTKASFMSATAERIVGYFRNESDIRMEKRDGKNWIVGIGYIWTWYAQELVAKLGEQGLRGMPVSIETLVDEMHKDGTTEVFTRYQILGTTILGVDVKPAVRDANIKVLSALGKESVTELTLRVASAQEKSATQNNKTETKKGVRKMPRINQLAPLYEGFTVLAVNGESVALLSEKNEPYLSSAKEENGEIIIGGKTALNEVKAVFGEGDESVSVNIESIIGGISARLNKAENDLKVEHDARVAAETALETMKANEQKRRAEAVKEAVKSALAANKENCDAEIADNLCDDLLTDEKVNEFVSMEKNGEFCGDKAAATEVDARCMSVIRDHNKTAKSNSAHQFAWDFAANAEQGEADGILSAIDRINK